MTLLLGLSTYHESVDITVTWKNLGRTQGVSHLEAFKSPVTHVVTRTRNSGIENTIDLLYKWD